MADLSTLTYSSLQTAVSDWLARPDLGTNIPDFIFLFEQNAQQVLRVRQQETLATLLSTSGEAQLPADYLTWRRLTWTGVPNRVLEYVQPDILRTNHPVINSSSLSLNAGIPSQFTIERNVIQVRPLDATVTATSTGNLELDYYASIPLLSTQGSTGTNWLLSGFPDCYLSGALHEAYIFQKDYEQAAIWQQRRDKNLEQLRTFDQKTRGPSAVRPMMLGRVP